jgi:hypothetical protein
MHKRRRYLLHYAPHEFKEISSSQKEKSPARLEESHPRDNEHGCRKFGAMSQ